METPDVPRQTLTSKQIRNRTLFAFAIFIAGIFTAYYSWQWLHRQPKEAGAYQPLRRTFETNEGIF